MIPDSAMHQAVLVVYAVFWAAITSSFGRLRLFALQDLAVGRTWTRFTWGLVLGNIAPVAGLALLMWLPEVPGFWGVAAGAAMGIFPVALPRLLHAATASNESLGKHYTEAEAAQVLKAWDRQWFKSIPKEAWESDWNCLSRVDAARSNRRWAHLWAAALVLVLPVSSLLLVLLFA